MSSQDLLPGRIETLNEEQELKLKQVWAYLFHFWDVPVNSSKVLTHNDGALRRNGTSSSSSTATSESTAKKAGSKLFGRFRRSNNTEKKEASKPTSRLSRASSVTSTRSRESIEAAYASNTVHDALKELKPEEIKSNLWSMLRVDYPDNLLLRFLRARKWDTDKTLNMLAYSLRWRLKEANPDDVIRRGELGAYEDKKSGYIKNIELRKAVIHGYDRLGHPIVYVRPRKHLSSDQTEEEMQQYSLLIIEQARLFLKEPTDAATILFDLSGFTMSNMDYAPVKHLISCFEAHYPECLGKLFIHKAPWIFPPIWNIIKNWLDPVVASKIVFTKTAKDLAEYVPEKYIPKSLGGECDYDYDDYEKPDGSLDTKLTKKDELKEVLNERNALVDQFIQATVSWIEATDDKSNAKWLTAKIDLGKQLTDNYIKLDPYVRSRSFYEYEGTLSL
ncbi:unnamed protein product [Kluyveromyces dobzhanskii CBS 2104]|uniref:WGS project CCBQ000000000 data, contig 00106 n=1 Tax=Kluyveromyces dobzhanskii CBS 2104 TaxID=1427455 RepID=A0A0A8L7W2_9SACH|nr:unnamed protein product [Kluyveromyces dobzhanskii CBS 2104]